MRRIAELYAYSVDKSTAVFNLRKKEEIAKKKKSEMNWLDKLCSEYEKTKKDTFDYFTVKKIEWKNKLNESKLSSCFKCENSKYGHLPWYKKLYYILKEHVYKLLNITDEEKNVDEGKNDDEEIPSAIPQPSSQEKTVTRDFVSYENLDYRGVQKTKNADDSLFNKYRERFRNVRDSEAYLSERSQSELVNRKLSSNGLITVRSNKIIGEESRVSEVCVVNSLAREATGGEVEAEADEKTGVDTVNQSIDVEGADDNRKNSLHVEDSPKFNIKNTWEKLSGYIS
ncbi:conserved Plasmodium protein, unknown function [Plasmodium knowlesi strain H]|uniref:Uncharacterized protein n=3 Tax=Plasmodium knowlesi TaxID=5850 RepID=A0A5K1VHR8_PLAKH|nr:conserved Plasmodium protein, unknown function [Plasmodium knowlesi strain H]OTN63895.1 Uncharacterized protein PKNOH_S140286700 [Plasmodium knowlesi]CAA9991278.1 conserved Plasmodium protein, unknown function [Plasmodium knowlesi strain H]SBO26369.1 conserved Plasmodium protein, unknown function [Plasmodium knowlesi strain H]SBO29015.1 conserved Plasmodium protein, unknown function [Plasmodium knowlesi strain H]VVS80752.1 conserved Plasmodium protein, unknown function [Plasmodium knowlesi |eukprot:XP_002262556.1 hypothetical protein, conserved in Plasmodium species [Plasmodium knowlesi strain H]